jgi:hypothetical protein
MSARYLHSIPHPIEPMSWLPLSDRLSHLPLILAGPILRRTEPESVTVWFALRKPCEVTVNIYATQAGEGVHVLDTHPLLRGTRTTIALGTHLYLVAVTARSVAGETLQPGQVYVYDAHFFQTEPNAESQVPLEQALNAESRSRVSVSYFDHQLPSFSLPPTHLNQLRILHGSCRKAHGGEADILAVVDTLIAQDCTQANTRPHQLFFTGDQIYGDDVADPMLMALTDAGNTLLGWEEALPIGLSSSAVESTTPSQLPPGQRSQIAEELGGFTAGLQGKAKLAKSHLFAFGEYCAAYLFVWSDVLWTEFPKGQEVHRRRKAIRSWNKEVNALQNMVQSLWQVRRVLANVPTYMICDDHDVSDDWYLNREWCERVLGKALGRRTVQNGLLAYALFQAWGNTPEQFEPDVTGGKLLQTAAAWSAFQGSHLENEALLAQFLGLPTNDPTTGLPRFRQDGNTLILDRHPSALTWNYTLRGSHHEVIVLDTRTWRGYPLDQADEAPPMLLSETAFNRQLRQPLQQTDRDNQTGQTAITTTFVIAPTNLVSLKAIDWVQHLNLKQGKVFANDVGDAWNIHKYAFSKLLKTLFEQRDRVIILSGDIHYGSVVCLQYWSLQRSESTESTETPHLLVQLTSSALKNTELKTRVVHTKVKSLVPEWTQDWAGWDMPPKLLGVRSIFGFKQFRPLADSAHSSPTIRRLYRNLGRSKRFAWNIAVTRSEDLPNWRYRVKWVNRQAAQVAYDRSPSSLHRQSWLSQGLNGLKLLWNNRWVQEGGEVVGLNNIGLVQLGEAEDTGKPIVMQDLFWYAPWRSGRVVYSRYCASLEFAEPPILIPIVEE